EGYNPLPWVKTHGIMESTFGTHSLLVSLPQAVKARGYHGGAPLALVPLANGKALIEDKLYVSHCDTPQFYFGTCLFDIKLRDYLIKIEKS
ncbi:MAG: hypothetical protein LUC44_00940, partial [Prevotellaceae bacterium]|nr:hypothetical protein [Prevotellaceae bacterium]